MPITTPAHAKYFNVLLIVARITLLITLVKTISIGGRQVLILDIPLLDDRVIQQNAKKFTPLFRILVQQTILIHSELIFCKKLLIPALQKFILS